MKEGLVLEINRDYVVVLSNSGEFLKLQRNSRAVIGEVYRAREYKKFKPSMFYAAAAIIAFMLTSFAGYTAYANQIVGVIDITGDKTVKLYFNRAGNVQKVEGVENPNSYKKLPVEKAIKELTENENSELKFTDSQKINASAKKLKNSNIDFNKINQSLQKTVEDKKIKIEKSKKNQDKQDKKDPVDKKSNSGSVKPGKANKNDSNNNNNNNSNNGKKDNNASKKKEKNDNASYAAEIGTYTNIIKTSSAVSKTVYSRSSSYVNNEYRRYIRQVSKDSRKFHLKSKNHLKKLK